MSKSTTFKEACSEAHPELCGLVTFYDNDLDLDSPDIRLHDIDFLSPDVMIHDMKSKEWLEFELAGFPGSDGTSYTKIDHDVYNTVLYSCDEGLACFVSLVHFRTSPILVCNPLAGIWKGLPLLPLEDFENKVFVVQLVMGDDPKFYRVILVSGDRGGNDFSAHVYDICVPLQHEKLSTVEKFKLHKENMHPILA